MASNDGTFGQVYDRFWSDAEILEDWTPEERLVWLYLLTCPQRNILGVFELSLKTAALQIGYSTDVLGTIIKRMEERGKVKYSPTTREIAVKKWLQYRGSRVWSNENLVKGILNCVETVKNKSLLSHIEGLERVYTIPAEEAKPIHDKDIELESDSSGTRVPDEHKTSGNTRTLCTLGHSDTLTLGTPAEVSAAVPVESVPTTSQTGKTLQEKHVFTTLWDQTIKASGLTLTKQQSGAQARACWELTDRLIKQFQDDAVFAAISLVQALAKLKANDRSAKGFWRLQPLTPMTLCGATVYGQVLESMREQRLDPAMQDVLEELFK